MALATALGYEAERRNVAQELGVDPCTFNPVLKKKLDDVAWVRFAGRFIVNTAISVLVRRSIIVSSTTWVNSTVYDIPAGDRSWGTRRNCRPWACRTPLSSYSRRTSGSH